MIGLSFIMFIHNIEAQEIAKRLEVSKAVVSFWMNKKRSIPQKRLNQIAKIFTGVETDYFQKELCKEDMIYLITKLNG